MRNILLFFFLFCGGRGGGVEVASLSQVQNISPRIGDQRQCKGRNIERLLHQCLHDRESWKHSSCEERPRSRWSSINHRNHTGGSEDQIECPQTEQKSWSGQMASIFSEWTFWRYMYTFLNFIYKIFERGSPSIWT